MAPPILNVFEHPGHLSILPAHSSLTFSTLPQLGQVAFIDARGSLQVTGRGEALAAARYLRRIIQSLRP
jgi:hypothetical protein